MRLVNNAILILLLGLVCGICLQYFLEISFVFWSISVGVFVLFVGLSKKYSSCFTIGNQCFTLGVFLLTLSVGAGITAFRNPENQKNHFTHYLSDKETILEVEILEKSYETDKSVAYITEIHKLDSVLVTGEITLNFYPKDSINSSLQIGNTLLLNGKIKLIPSPQNPYDFDYKSYMEKQNVWGRVEVRPEYYRLLDYQNLGAISLSEKIRNFIILKLKENHLSADILSVTEALLLGQRDDLSDTVYQNYIDSGGVHILAISGMHIGILTSILMILLSFIRGFKGASSLKIFIVALLLWSYAFLVGMSPSVMRSVTMFSLMSVGWYLNRRKGVYDAWLLALFLLLLYNPNYLFSVGFQLSFSAVFFIITLVPIFQKIWTPKNKIVKYIVLLFYVSVAAQMGVLPISLYYFHQYPALFFVTNMLIIPFLALILSLGITTIVLSSLSILPSFVKYMYSYAITYMNKVTEYVAAQEDFIFRHIYFDQWMFLFSFLILFSFILWLRKRNPMRTYIFLSTIILFQLLLIFNHFQIKKQKGIWFLHSYKNSVIALQNKDKLQIYADTITPSVHHLVDNFQNKTQVSEVLYDSISSVIFYDDKTILIIDDRSIYPVNPVKKAELIYLKSSPKINLDRVLSIYNPELIIADGSNYPSYIHQWEKTCQKRKVRFHSTLENGF